MGYFTRLRARARNEGGWSGYKYTGSAAAGADIVSENTWCVVYGADVVYQSDRERLNAVTVATNFVNPLSSGNPCTVFCYLYTSDPTQNGSFDVDSVPPGYIASAADSFEAGTAGSYRAFSFTGLDARPAKLFFWFASTVSYESYGSNRIYHYATGNYSATLDTGTRTPALEGSFAGGDSGGGSGGTGETGGEYTAVASGSYSSIFAQRDFSLSRKWHTASYTALSFTGSGTARFSCAHGSGGDSFLQLRAYLTKSSGFDSSSGMPTGTVLASQSGGDWYSFDCQVVSGQTYYLWTIIDYCGTDTVPLNISILPESWSFSLANKGSSTNIAQSTKSFSMSMSAFQTGRMTLSFAYGGYVDISVSAGEGAFNAVVFVSDQQNIDNATGLPLNYSESFSLGYTGSMLVEKGKSYYFFAIYNGGSEAGSVTFTVTPPPVVWTQGGSNSYSLIKSAVSPSISLGAQKYHYIKLSTACSGILWIKANSIAAGDGGLCIYVSTRDCFDSQYGYPAEAEATISLYAGYETPIDLIAGKNYYFYVVNDDYSQSLRASLTLTPAVPPEGYSEELQRHHVVEESFISEQYIRRYSYSVNTFDFRYAGQAVLSIEKPEREDGKTVHLRAYLCIDSGFDEVNGVPVATVLASYTGGKENCSFTVTVEAEHEYWLYTVCEELYGDYTAELELSVISPPPRYFSVTETGEYLGLSESLDYSAAPGESGVLRLELSFMEGGVAEISAQPKEGTEYLMGWLSLSPYLDGYTGAPVQDTVKSARGSSESPALSLSVPVRRLTSYYLFIRGRGLYDRAVFEVSLSRSPAAATMFRQGKSVRAQPYLYRDGQWHAAMPFCRSGGSWKGCG